MSAVARAVPGVVDAHDVRARRAGRALYVLLHVSAPPDLPLERAHALSEEVRHEVLHSFPGVVQVDVHVDPHAEDPATHHQETAHHFGA